MHWIATCMSAVRVDDCTDSDPDSSRKVIEDLGSDVDSDPGKIAIRRGSWKSRLVDWELLRTTLDRVCSCVSHHGVSCLQPFKEPAALERLQSDRRAFSVMHKLDQDQLANNKMISMNSKQAVEFNISLLFSSCVRIILGLYSDIRPDAWSQYAPGPAEC